MGYGSYSLESYASIPSQTTHTYNSSWGGGEDRQAPFDLDPQNLYGRPNQAQESANPMPIDPALYRLPDDTIVVSEPNCTPRDHTSTESRPGSENPINDDMKLAKEAAETPINGKRKRFACHYDGCLREARDQDGLSKHLLTHTNKRPHKCTTCNDGFSRTDSRDRHQLKCRGVNKNRVRPTFKCDCCGALFELKGGRNRHQSICSKTSGLNMSLPRTAATSIQVEPNSARPISGLENPTNNDMKLAKEAAENPIKGKGKPLACNYPGCDYTNSRSNAFSKHLLIHTKQRPFKCMICKEAYQQVGTRNRHQKTCRGINNKRVLRIYICKYCNEPLETMGDRNLHEKICSKTSGMNMSLPRTRLKRKNIRDCHQRARIKTELRAIRPRPTATPIQAGTNSKPTEDPINGNWIPPASSPPSSIAEPFYQSDNVTQAIDAPSLYESPDQCRAPSKDVEGDFYALQTYTGNSQDFHESMGISEQPHDLNKLWVKDVMPIGQTDEAPTTSRAPYATMTISQSQYHHVHGLEPPPKMMRRDEVLGGAPNAVGQVGMPDPAPRPQGPQLKFTPEDDQLLIELKEDKNLTWNQIVDFFPGRASGTLQVRYCTKLKAKTKNWTDESDSKLRTAIRDHENKKWRIIANKVGTGFTPAACRERAEQLIAKNLATLAAPSPS